MNPQTTLSYLAVGLGVLLIVVGLGLIATREAAAPAQPGDPGAPQADEETQLDEAALTSASERRHRPGSFSFMPYRDGSTSRKPGLDLVDDDDNPEVSVAKDGLPMTRTPIFTWFTLFCGLFLVATGTLIFILRKSVER